MDRCNPTIIDPPSARDAGQLLVGHFRTFDGPTVVTKRNFSLLRGKSLQEAPNRLVKIDVESQTITKSDRENPRRRSSTDSVNSYPISPSSSVDEYPHPLGVGHRRASGGGGGGGILDRSTNSWDWPLGEPKISNADDRIEAVFNFYPFSPQEVWATVMGNELIIHCCKTDRFSVVPAGQREIFRSYTLPLNVNSKSARFEIVQNRHLKISIRKELPLKMAIAFYGVVDLDECNSDLESNSSDDGEQVSTTTDETASV